MSNAHLYLYCRICALLLQCLQYFHWNLWAHFPAHPLIRWHPLTTTFMTPNLSCLKKEQFQQIKTIVFSLPTACSDWKIPSMFYNVVTVCWNNNFLLIFVLPQHDLTKKIDLWCHPLSWNFSSSSSHLPDSLHPSSLDSLGYIISLSTEIPLSFPPQWGIVGKKCDPGILDPSRFSAQIRKVEARLGKLAKIRKVETN